jgi:surface antigen
MHPFPRALCSALAISASLGLVLAGCAPPPSMGQAQYEAPPPQYVPPQPYGQTQPYQPYMAPPQYAPPPPPPGVAPGIAPGAAYAPPPGAAPYPAPQYAPPGAVPAVQQTYGTDNHACDRGLLTNVFSNSTNNLVGSALGAAAGGLVGSQFGKGGGNTAMTIVGILGGALVGGYVGRQMDPVDQGCVSRALENTPTAQTVAWQNPDTGASYWVTPTQTFTEPDGTPCRQYVTDAVIDGQPTKATGVACRQPDGSWKIRG